MDVAVGGRADRIAAAMEEEGFGRAVEISSRPPRVFRVAGRREIDIAEIEGNSIEEDLRRRDFTVNAIALDLARREWIDPFGGRQALSEGRLRMVSPRNLRDDPLRVLRAARFLATHGLRPDAPTSRACRAAAPGLSGVAPERIRAEWVKLIRSPGAAKAVAWAGRTGVLAPAFGLDAAVAARLAASAGKFDAAPILRLPPDSRARVRTALLCARIGLRPGEAASWLAARRFGRAESGDAALLLRLVDDARAARDERSLWRWVRDAGPLAGDALALMRVLSPRLPGRARALARRVRLARGRRLSISGADVMAWSGVGAGPEVGRLLSELEIEVLRGALRSRREARNWLSGQGPGGPWTAIIRTP